MDRWSGCTIRMNKRITRAQQALLLFFVVLGAGLRLFFLFGPMCHDEAETFVVFASKSLWVGLSKYTLPNNQIFHTLLVHESVSLFGNAPWAIRLPALLAGILVIPATFFAMEGFFGQKPALLATGLVAVSWPLVSYSGNARGYTIQTLLFLLLLIVAKRIKRKNDMASWVCFVFLGTLGLFTAPTMIYFFGAVAIWLFVSALRGDTQVLPTKLALKLVLSCVAVVVLVLLLYTPALLRTGLTRDVLRPTTYSLRMVPFVLQVPIRMVGTVAFFTFSVMFSFSRSAPVMVIIIIATAALTVFLAYGCVLATVRNKWLSKHKTNLLLIALFWSTLIVLAQGYFPPERVFIPIIPLYFGYASAGLCFAWSRLRARYRLPAGRTVAYGMLVGLVVVCTAVLMIAQVPWQPRDMTTMRDAGAMASKLKQILRPKDVVYAEPITRMSLEYYFLKDGIPLSYIYFVQDNNRGKREVPGRAFIVMDYLDGAPPEKTIRWAGLPPLSQTRMDLAVCCDNSAAFLLTWPKRTVSGKEI